MVVKKWRGDVVQLLDPFVCQVAAPFQAFLRMSLYILGPRDDICLHFFSESGSLSVAPAETRDSNTFLSSSTRFPFGLHSL